MGLEHRLQQRVEIHGGGCTHVGLFFFKTVTVFCFLVFEPWLLFIGIQTVAAVMRTVALVS
jgi:hypothetical protein